MLQFTPSGKWLMNICNTHLCSSAGKVVLLPDTALFDRLQFYFVKRRIHTLIKHVTRSIVKKRLFDLHAILGSFHYTMTSLWDELLVFTVVQKVSFWQSHNIILSEQEKIEGVLDDYLQEVKQLHTKSLQVLSQKIEDLRLRSEQNLHHAKEKDMQNMEVFASLY